MFKLTSISTSITPGSLASKFAYKVPDTSNNSISSNKSSTSRANKYTRVDNKKTSSTGIRAMVPGRK